MISITNSCLLRTWDSFPDLSRIYFFFYLNAKLRCQLHLMSYWSSTWYSWKWIDFAYMFSVVTAVTIASYIFFVHLLFSGKCSREILSGTSLQYWKYEIWIVKYRRKKNKEVIAGVYFYMNPKCKETAYK